MAADVHPNAIYLNNQPYRLRSYFRSVTDDLISRFGSAEQGQTNLDLLKAETQKSYRGGMFQRVLDDPEKVSSIENGYYNPLDNNLYPTPSWRHAADTGFSTDNAVYSVGSMGSGGLSSSCFYRSKFYAAYRNTGAGTINNNLVTIDSSGNVDTVTLPPELQASQTRIRMVTFGDYIFLAAYSITGDSSAYRYDGTSFTDVTGDFYDFAVFNNKLYGVTASQVLCEITNHTATPITWSELGAIGGVKAPGNDGLTGYNMAIEFNGALYLGCDYGLYRYDGTSIKTVLDYRNASSSRNFDNLAVFNGRLYYTIGNKLYKFDGTNIELLQDFTDADAISNLLGGTDRLWITTKADLGVPYGDKWANATTYEISLFCYNDVGFFRYNTFADNVPLQYVNIGLMAAGDYIVVVIPDIYLNASLEERSFGGKFHFLDLTDEFTTTRAGSSLVVTSSIMDNEYPSVAKTHLGLLTNYGGLTAGEGVLKVEASYFTDGAWTAYAEIWNSSTVETGDITSDYLLYDQSDGSSPTLMTAPAVYHKMRLRTTLTMSDTTPTTLPYLTDQSVRYVIQPRFRKKWLVELDIAGRDMADLMTPRNSDGTLEDRSSNFLRKNLYDVYRNKLPILLYDVDWTQVKVTTADTASLTVKGVDFIASGDTIAIQEASAGVDVWNNRTVETATYDDANDQTTLTCRSAGYRQSLGASNGLTAVAGDQVRTSHVVYIRSWRNERYLLDDNTVRADDGYTDIPSVVTLELVEV